MKKKKLILIGGLVLALGGGGAYMSGVLGGTDTAEDGAVEEVVEEALPETTFVELDEISLSIIQRGKLTDIVHLDLTLEANLESAALVLQNMALLRDRIQLALMANLEQRIGQDMPLIDIPEIKSTIMGLGARIFGEGVILDVHLLEDWHEHF